MNSSTTSRTGSGAFTLIELLIVIAIIGVLAGLLLAALGLVRDTARKTQAKKEVNEIADAIRTYYIEHSTYPPDTQDWGTVGGYDEREYTVPPGKDIDRRSIHKYLASELQTSRRGRRTQQMALKEERIQDHVTDELGQRIGVYVDPWDNPYEIDCMHMVYTGGKWRQKGWPYKSAGSQPTREQLSKYTKKFKVMSRGKDGLTSAFPFAVSMDMVEKGYILDDCTSW